MELELQVVVRYRGMLGTESRSSAWPLSHLPPPTLHVQSWLLQKTRDTLLHAHGRL